MDGGTLQKENIPRVERADSVNRVPTLHIHLTAGLQKPIQHS